MDGYATSFLTEWFQSPYNEEVAMEFPTEVNASSFQFQSPYNDEVAISPGYPILDNEWFQSPYNEEVAIVNAFRCSQAHKKFQSPYNEEVAIQSIRVILITKIRFNPHITRKLQLILQNVPFSIHSVSIPI